MNTPSKMLIYKIENKLNGKIYVGQTRRTLEERMNEHKKECCKNCYIDRAIKKYGMENFKTEILEFCKTIEEMNEREIYWIKKLNCKFPNGYNLADGGKDSAGYITTPELSAKLSALRKGRKIPPEQRAKISASLKGKIFSEETKAKISSAKLGHTVSEETRTKLRKANIGKKASENTRLKMSASCKTKVAVRCVETETIFESITAAAKWSGVSHSVITAACKNSKHTGGGCHWEYYSGQSS